MLTVKGREKLLARVTSENKQDLIAVLAEAKKRVKRRLFSAASDSSFSTSEAAKQRIFKSLSQFYLSLQGDLDDWSVSSVRHTSGAFYDVLKDDLAADGIDVDGFSVFSKRNLSEYIERIHPFNADKMAAVNVHLNPHLSRMLETDVRALRNAVVDGFRVSEVAGLTAQERWVEIQKALVKYADNPDTWQFIDMAGRRWQKNNYFNMLNRTISANVARDTYHDGLTESGRDVVQLIGGLSENSHPACVKWEGTIFSLTGETPGLPALQEYIDDGGFHPNCVHTTVYVSEYEQAEVA